jgi:hypothetical protein
MFIAILTLLSALSISGVAIFYSVIGLATIFPGAFVPVVIMGGVLEVGKLITASWLYRNWKFTPFMLKTYLTTAVIILSLITSMGIFGFLSKAHLEQNLASDTLIQRINILKDKIESEKMSITRQNSIIERAEKSISRDTGTASGDIEVQQSIIADANEKLKTLLTVETNTVRDLNDRLKVLDKNVSDILTSNKSFFNEEKAAAELKTSQKEEREQIAINVKEAQVRIAELKADHKQEIAKAQDIIANMRTGSQDNKGQFNKEIETAEKKIFDSQGNIDLYIVEKQPLEKEMLTLEAEIGPVKYIAALAVDWGITDQVETSKAVRWVILLLIVVFDPLAVLLLIAANQSLMRRFPPEAPKPQEIVDLEKPDEESVDLKWNAMMDKSDAVAKMEEATEQLQEWKEKLEAFNKKVPKTEDKQVEIIQEDLQKKTEDKEIVADNNKDGFNPDEHLYDLPEEPKVDKEKQLEEFKKREAEEKKALEEYAEKAKQEEVTATVEEALKMHESESVVTPLEEPSIAEQIEEVMETERTRPDFTEVIEPEVEIEKVKDFVKNSKPRVMRTLRRNEDKPPKPILSNWQRAELLNNFHKEHGNFEDVEDYVQNEEQNEKSLWNKSKNMTSEMNYHERMEQRINDLMSKIENNEIKLDDLSQDDQRVINEINNQKNNG